MEIVILEVTTYRVYGGGIHWYGRLVFAEMENRKHIDVTKTLMSYEAARLNKQGIAGQPGQYKPGDETYRLDSQEEVCEKALEVFGERWPDGLLLEGRWVRAGPQRILAGPPQLVALLEILYFQAEAIGWWDDDANDATMDRLCTEWKSVLDSWQVEPIPLQKAPPVEPDPIPVEEPRPPEPTPEPPEERLSRKEVWAHARTISIEVEAKDPWVKTEGGGYGYTVFRTFVTDVFDTDGNEIGSIGGGTGYVTLSIRGRNREWFIRHDDLWYAFLAALYRDGLITDEELQELG